jgi:hypothetical protein
MQGGGLENDWYKLQELVSQLSLNAPYPKDASGGCQKGDVPPSVWGVWREAAVLLIAKKNLDLWEAKNDTR